MFCPQCGQRQTSNDARFCPSCGLPLNVVAEVLANGGQLPRHLPASGAGQLTPRGRGIRQGAFLMLSTLVVVPIVVILFVRLLGMSTFMIPLASVLCVMGGLLRMLYAMLFESNDPAEAPGATTAHYVPPAAPPNYLGEPQQTHVLPPRQSTHAYARPQRYNTGGLVEPPRASVTDHTTRLLDKQPDEPPR